MSHDRRSVLTAIGLALPVRYRYPARRCARSRPTRPRYCGCVPLRKPCERPSALWRFRHRRV